LKLRRRVADQRRRAADIGGEHFGDQERKGRDLQLAGDGKRHRRHQQHRADIVEDCGDEERHQLNQQEKRGWMRAGKLRRAYGGILKHARALGDRGDDHQPGERADGVPVDALERLGLVERAGQHRNASGDQRDDGAVDPVPDDDRIGHA
jgi:hypothetical protein